jgi:hypothetical protein
MKNSEEGAFPKPDNDNYLDQNGLTKREYFAVIAMQGMLASGRFRFIELETPNLAVQYADELLKELES